MTSNAVKTKRRNVGDIAINSSNVVRGTATASTSVTVSTLRPPCDSQPFE